MVMIVWIEIQRGGVRCEDRLSFLKLRYLSGTICT